LSTIAVWIDRGQVMQYGAPADVIKGYCEQVASSTAHSHSVDLSVHAGRRPGMSPLLRRVSLFDAHDQPTTSVPLGGRCAIELELGDFAAGSDTALMITICDLFGTSLASVHSKTHSSLNLAGLRRARARCVIEDLRLVPGDYMLTVTMRDA